MERELYVRNLFNKHYSTNIDNSPLQTNKTSYCSDLSIINPILEKDVSDYEKTDNNLDIDLNIYKDITITLIECYDGVLKEINIERNVFIKFNNTFSFTQKQQQNDNIIVEINKGILNNETLIIKNKGHMIKNNTNYTYGNIVIHVIINTIKASELASFFNFSSKLKFHENDYYEKQGNNLVCHKFISLKQSLCGFEFILIHLNRQCYKIKSSSNIVFYNGKTQYVNKNGFIRNSICGDFLINYHVIFPETLDPFTVEQLRQLL